MGWCCHEKVDKDESQKCTIYAKIAQWTWGLITHTPRQGTTLHPTRAWVVPGPLPSLSEELVAVSVTHVYILLRALWLGEIKAITA